MIRKFPYSITIHRDIEASDYREAKDIFMNQLEAIGLNADKDFYEDEFVLHLRDMCLCNGCEKPHYHCQNCNAFFYDPDGCPGC